MLIIYLKKKAVKKNKKGLPAMLPDFDRAQTDRPAPFLFQLAFYSILFTA